MTLTTQAQDVLDCYRQNMAGRGHGGWQALAQILGTSRGAAWEIAHGKRTMTPDQELRWTLYRSIGNPNVTVKRITTCPSCGQLHQVDDCHGHDGQPTLVPVGARIVRPKPKPPAWVTQAADWLCQQEQRP